MGPMLKMLRTMSNKSLASQQSSGSDDGGQAMSRTPSSASISNKYCFTPEPGHLVASPGTPGSRTPRSDPKSDDQNDVLQNDRRRYLLLASAAFFLLPFYRTLLRLLLALLLPSLTSVSLILGVVCLVCAVTGSPQLRRAEQHFRKLVDAGREPLRHLLKAPEHITAVLSACLSINRELRGVRKDVQNIRAKVSFLPNPAKQYWTQVYSEDATLSIHT